MDDLREASFPFPIADTDSGPSLEYTRDEVTLRFVDYTEMPRQVTFDDVASIRISSIDADPRDLLDDRTYIVDNSSLIGRLTEVGEIVNPDDYTHQIVCFNETGQFLEIVYRRMVAGV